MSGYIGRWIIALSRNRFQLNRITALDPAKPLFYTKFIFLPISLSARDAKVNQNHPLNAQIIYLVILFPDSRRLSHRCRFAWC